MATVVMCGCGEVLEAEDDERLMAEVDAHVADAHPELLGTLSPLELAGRQPDESAAA